MLCLKVQKDNAAMDLAIFLLYYMNNIGYPSPLLDGFDKANPITSKFVLDLDLELG